MLISARRKARKLYAKCVRTVKKSFRRLKFWWKLFRRYLRSNHIHIQKVIILVEDVVSTVAASWRLLCTPFNFTHCLQWTAKGILNALLGLIPAKTMLYLNGILSWLLLNSLNVTFVVAPALGPGVIKIVLILLLSWLVFYLRSKMKSKPVKAVKIVVDGGEIIGAFRELVIA